MQHGDLIPIDDLCLLHELRLGGMFTYIAGGPVLLVESRGNLKVE